MFADTVLGTIDDVARGVRGWLKQDHSQYFPIACPHTKQILALDNGSLLSVVKVNGYNGQFFPANFESLRKKWAQFTQTLANDATTEGLDLFWSYEYDPNGMTGKTQAYRGPVIDACESRGLNVRDIYEEDAEVYAAICATEKQYLLVVTHLNSLPKADRKAALKQRTKGMAGVMQGQGAMTMALGVKALEVVHEQHVNKVLSFMTGLEVPYDVERLDASDALTEMRISLMPETTASTWKPILNVTRSRFRPTENVDESRRKNAGNGQPTDWTFALPPPLTQQMMPNEVLDLGKYAVVGDRIYAPMHVTELATHPEPLEKLLSACHRRKLPMRIVYTISADSASANYWNRLFADFFSFMSASNRQISKADKAMTAYKESNGAVYGYGISATTWVNTNVMYTKTGQPLYNVATLQRQAAELETLLQQWGGQQVSTLFGCSIESVMSATPGCMAVPNCPKAPQIELDILAQLPLMRPTNRWSPVDSIWFTTRDGVLSPYQPMSELQSSMVQFVLGGMGYGKSNFISETLFNMATSPRAVEMPYLRFMDFGASAAGVVDMVKASLPEDRQHEAIFEYFDTSGGMIKNLFDTPLGLRYPLSAQREFLMVWLMQLCSELIKQIGVSTLSSMISTAIDRAYMMCDTRTNLAERQLYTPQDLPEGISEDIAKYELEIDDRTDYLEIVDQLIAIGLRNKDQHVLHLAKVIQRYAVPDFNTFIRALDSLRDQFSSVPKLPGGTDAIDAVSTALVNAAKQFPLFVGRTTRDISEARICVFDMSKAFGRDISDYGSWKRSVYFLVAYRLLTEDLFVSVDQTGGEMVIDQERLQLSDELLEYHMQYLRRQDAILKMFGADEIHNLGKAPGALEIIASVTFEARKYRAGLLLGSQNMDHMPDDVVELATSVFIFGANQSAVQAKALGNRLGLSDDEVHALAAVTQPNAEKGAEVFVIHKTTSGTQRMLLQFRLGTIKRWAYATDAMERTLRKMLYMQGPSTAWARKVLAENVKDVKKAIKIERSVNTGLSEEDALRAIAARLLQKADSAII